MADTLKNIGKNMNKKCVKCGASFFAINGYYKKCVNCRYPKNPRQPKLKVIANVGIFYKYILNSRLKTENKNKIIERLNISKE